MDDIYSMPGPKFFRMAHRMPAYRGVMRERVVALAQQQGQQQPAGQRRAAPAASGGREMVPGTKAALQASPAFKGIFSFG